jgi:lipopolysaccharide transport system permease protein
MQSSQVLAPSPPRRIRRIKPSRGLVPIDFGELWGYRTLLYLLIWRDVRTRYRQTLLSGFWAIFRPLSTMILFSLIFGGLAHIKSGADVPYPLFVYTGMVAWTYFASAVGNGSTSLLSNAGLLTKVYFPRLYTPLMSVSAPIVDLGLALVVLFGLFGWFHRWPSWHLIFLPAFVLLALLLALGITLWVSALTVKYRDLGFSVPFLTQIWLYVTPVIYPPSFIPERLRWLLALNPMTGVVDGFRWALLGYPFPRALFVASSVGATVLLVGAGMFVFRRAERTIADLI